MSKPKQNHAAVVRDTLRRRILRCELRPGERVIINDLCEEFGVSLGAIREALSGLEGEGLVQAQAKRGFQVIGVSIEDMFDLTRARIEIENACLRLSIGEGDLAWEGQVVGALHRLNATPRETGEIRQMSSAWSEAHRAFHTALLAGCRNQTLLAIQRGLFDRAERYRRLSVPLDPIRRDVAAEHGALAEAVLRRDGTLAAELMETHLGRTAMLISAAIEHGMPSIILQASK